MQHKHLFLGRDGGDGSPVNRCLGTEVIQAVTLRTLHSLGGTMEWYLQMPPDFYLSPCISVSLPSFGCPIIGTLIVELVLFLFHSF